MAAKLYPDKLHPPSDGCGLMLYLWCCILEKLRRPQHQGECVSKRVVSYLSGNCLRAASPLATAPASCSFLSAPAPPACIAFAMSRCLEGLGLSTSRTLQRCAKVCGRVHGAMVCKHRHSRRKQRPCLHGCVVARQYQAVCERQASGSCCSQKDGKRHLGALRNCKASWGGRCRHCILTEDVRAAPCAAAHAAAELRSERSGCCHTTKPAGYCAPPSCVGAPRTTRQRAILRTQSVYVELPIDARILYSPLRHC